MKLSKIKQAALIGLGLAALSPTVPATQNAATPQTQSQGQNQNTKEQITHKVVSPRNIIKNMAGGMHVEGHMVGIPPHIYGQYHVRRCTHKRSNF